MAGLAKFALGAAAGAVSAGCLALTAATNMAHSHCQVPCGIYDDPRRVRSMQEDAATIRKATAQIESLAGSAHSAQTLNQITRWVNTKEEHSSRIIETVATYFLTQKVKPVAKGAKGYPEYLEVLATHHAVMAAAMKAKQTVSADSVAALDAKIAALESLYPHSH